MNWGTRDSENSFGYPGELYLYTNSIPMRFDVHGIISRVTLPQLFLLQLNDIPRSDA